MSHMLLFHDLISWNASSMDLSYCLNSEHAIRLLLTIIDDAMFYFYITFCTFLYFKFSSDFRDLF